MLLYLGLAIGSLLKPRFVGPEGRLNRRCLLYKNSRPKSPTKCTIAQMKVKPML